MKMQQIFFERTTTTNEKYRKTHQAPKKKP